MKRSEWIEALALMRLNWPHISLPDKAATDKWFAELERFPGEQVKAAIEALYRDGREYPPNGAQILGKLSELSRDDGDWGEAWALAKRANLKSDPRVGIEWLVKRSPAAAEAVRRLSCGSSRALMGFQLDDEPTVRAQFRDVYKSVCADGRRSDLYAGLPSAGLRGLSGKGPRQLKDALKQALPAAPTDPEQAPKQLR